MKQITVYFSDLEEKRLILKILKDFEITNIGEFTRSIIFKLPENDHNVQNAFNIGYKIAKEIWKL